MSESLVEADNGEEHKRTDADLQPFTAALLECVTPKEVIDAVVDHGIAVLGARAALVMLVTEDGKDLEIVAARGYDTDTLSLWERFPLSAPLPLSDVVRTGEPLYLEDQAAWARLYPNLTPLVEEGSRASVSLPFSVRRRAFGAVHFAFVEPRPFSETDKSFLNELARQGTLALERAQLIEKVQQQQREAENARAEAETARGRLAFLARASALLSESLDYEVQLERLAHLVVPEIADWAAIDILSDEGILVRLAVAHCVPEREDLMREAQRRFPAEAQGDHTLLTVARTGTPLYVPWITPEMIGQARQDPEHRRLIQSVGLRALICQPLQARGRILGLITLGMAGEPPIGTGRAFTRESTVVAAELANRAAIAVDNARLFSAVAAGKRKAEAILESIGEMFYAVDASWKLTYVNQRVEKLWGRHRDELLGVNIWELFPVAVDSVSYTAQIDAMRERRAVSFETISAVLGKWIEGTAYPTEEGGISVYFRDIQLRKITQETLRQSTEALRSSDARYRRLLETALEGILFLDADAQITYVNQQMVRMLGYDAPEELIGQTVYFLFFPEETHRAKDRWEARLQGVHERYELRLRRKDGSACWAIAHVSIERDEEDDTFRGTFTMFTDITERRATLQALQEKSNEISSILESITDAFFAVDHEWRFTYVNNAAERVLMRQREDLLGHSLWTAFPGTVGSTFEVEYRRAIQKRVSVSFIEYYPPMEIWFDVHAYPSEVGLSVYFRNINQQRQAEEEREGLLLEQQRLLAELQEAGTRQRRFLREMLSSLTEGHLRLCDLPEELPAPLPLSHEPLSLALSNLRVFRKQVEAVGGELQLPRERQQDFLTAVGEATMNAIVHAGSGEGEVRYDSVTGTIQVWVRDQGQGIAEDAIHRATLEKGYSSAGTLGHGFWLMLKTADRIYLLTGPTGTTVVLEHERELPQPVWMQDIDL